MGSIEVELGKSNGVRFIPMASYNSLPATHHVPMETLLPSGKMLTRIRMESVKHHTKVPASRNFGTSRPHWPKGSRQHGFQKQFRNVESKNFSTPSPLYRAFPGPELEESGWRVVVAVKHPWTYSSRLWEGHYLYLCSWMETTGYGIFLCVNVKNLYISHSLHHVSKLTLTKLWIVRDTHFILHPIHIQTPPDTLQSPLGQLSVAPCVLINWFEAAKTSWRRTTLELLSY